MRTGAREDAGQHEIVGSEEQYVLGAHPLQSDVDRAIRVEIDRIDHELRERVVAMARATWILSSVD